MPRNSDKSADKRRSEAALKAALAASARSASLADLLLERSDYNSIVCSGAGSSAGVLGCSAAICCNSRDGFFAL